jgi:hypothetical protein
MIGLAADRSDMVWSVTLESTDFTGLPFYSSDQIAQRPDFGQLLRKIRNANCFSSRQLFPIFWYPRNPLHRSLLAFDGVPILDQHTRTL